MANFYRPLITLAGLLRTSAQEQAFNFDAVQQLLQSQPPARRLLLLIDQFEEIFTQTEREERCVFCSVLQTLRTLQNCMLLLTLRADFYPDLMTSPLWPVASTERIEIAPLRGEAL